ncbi:MAG TPA: glycoside hydrolase family 20 protein [Acidobacteriota bacterium]|nr:glycoside hydrolase family 20 protein [Acidobacteriota bacterium]
MKLDMRHPRMIAFAGFAIALGAMSCASVPARREAATQAGLSITPAPLRSEARPGRFVLGPSTKIVVLESQAGVMPVASYLKGMLGRPTGFDLGIEAAAGAAKETAVRAGSIALRLEDLETRLGQEGYLLEAGTNGILIRAAAPAGLFYGTQTLRQLLPAAIEGPSAASGERAWIVPGVAIEDRPRFSWRGALLDCSRHFYPKNFVLRWIDILAMHKLNTFHWHLTDDQGWRIEIKRYPRLTEVGAWRVDREDKPWNARELQKPGEAATYGGFYTQDDVREIVAYAASRQVTIVPEIEMPGHAKAALTAYPEFSCTGGPFTVPPGGYWPITDIFCPGNDGTFEFLANVLAEVVDLFPGSFVHIGGDEANKAEWKRCPKCQARMKAEGLKDENELQSYFVRRMEKVLSAKGRRLIGWDEILEGGLAPQATVMSWRGIEGGITAARAGHDVVMSPTSHCYIDYYQGNPAVEPLAIGGYVPLRKVYEFEPVPEALTGTEAGHVFGGQANLWTEYVPDGKHAEYMALPRLAALAEVVWSAKSRRDWNDFASRIPHLFDVYAAAGMNFARSAYVVAIRAEATPGANRAAVALETEITGLDLRYTTNGSDPGPSSKLSAKPVVLRKTVELRAAAFRGRERLSPAVSTERFLVHLASGRKPALAEPFSPSYPGGGDRALTDGLLGSHDHAGGRWQGFEGSDLDAVIDLGAPRPLRRIAVRCLQNINSWAFLPASVEFAVSPDGRSFATVAEVRNDVSPRQAEVSVKEFSATVDGQRARYVRVRARTIGAVPDWHFGAGGKAWLFADEIIVE